MTDIELPEGMPQWIADHIRLYYSDPVQAHHWDSSVAGGPGVLPTLLLVTRGRSSGRPRPVPLIYGETDGGYVVIASKGGAPEHPAWYRNLQEEAECEIRVGARVMTARAREAQGDERARLWREMADIYPPYDDYQASAGEREIPVLVLEPAL